ncbi:MAG: cytochrome c3 family protein [Thaumarchaeota archaeon]|nr:cytochrome c3 family protein [Nitrososphaerota archaeon]
MNSRQYLLAVLMLAAGLAIGYAGMQMVTPQQIPVIATSTATTTSTVITTSITTTTTAITATTTSTATTIASTITTTTARVTSTATTTSTVITNVTVTTTTQEVMPAGNVMQLHLNTTTVSSGTCRWCHDVISEVSLRQDEETPHSAHLSSDLLKMECNTCHNVVDLNEKSAASIRKQVDTTFCAKCHSSFPKKMDDAYQKIDCTTCHSNWKDRMGAEAASFVNMDLIQPKDCLGCHGGRAWYVGGV